MINGNESVHSLGTGREGGAKYTVVIGYFQGQYHLNVNVKPV